MGQALFHKSRLIVLVVEDEPLMRMSAVEIVEDAGFTALEAADADEAIRILEQRDDIHILFTDVDMPGSMDGLKLAHFVRNRWPPVKMIVTSGQTRVEEGELPTGSRFFGKPYRLSQIAGALREMTA